MNKIKSVNELLANVSKYDECIIRLDDKEWDSKLQDVKESLDKQRMQYNQSHTTEGDIWIYLIK